MKNTIGTCSLCGGPVQVPEFWGGCVPPQPTCAHCGAVAKPTYGPTIQMVRPMLPWRSQQTFTTYDGVHWDRIF